MPSFWTPRCSTHPMHKSASSVWPMWTNIECWLGAWSCEKSNSFWKTCGSSYRNLTKKSTCMYSFSSKTKTKSSSQCRSSLTLKSWGKSLTWKIKKRPMIYWRQWQSSWRTAVHESRKKSPATDYSSPSTWFKNRGRRSSPWEWAKRH